jgi:N-acetylglucosamine kinase-like BadF-type ATPase
MAPARYVIGIDGGGTKTAAALCTLDGAILAEAQAGPSHMHAVGVERAAATILDTVASCCHTIGCTTEEIGSLVAGVAGAGRASDQERLTNELRRLAAERRMVLDRITVDSDARIALEGALGGKPGIVVIAGTGSIVLGKDDKGRVQRAGGWGRLIGDEGSGQAIGSAAFRAVAQMIDGRGTKTRLLKMFHEAHGLGTQEAIVAKLYREGFDIASVTPIVFAAAAKGDVVAKRIVAQERDELVEIIAACLRKLNAGSRTRVRRPIAFAGSLVTTDNLYASAVRSAIRRRLPLLRIQEAEASPVLGAVLMATAIARQPVRTS